MAIPTANATAPPTTSRGLGSDESRDGTPKINASAPTNAKIKLTILLILSMSIIIRSIENFYLYPFHEPKLYREKFHINEP